MDTEVIATEAQIVRREEPQTLPQGMRDSRALVSIIERAALDKDYPIDRLQQLFELKKQWESDEARKAFHASMARFAAEAPTILKDHHVKYKNRDGSLTEYDHNTLGHACEMIVPALGRVGIKHKWVPKQNGNEIEVTCVLTHELGHSESVSLHGPYDDSGGKNAIQAIKSAKTYLENATLLAAVGLAPVFGDDDDDGRNAGEVSEKITEHQAADLHALITEGGSDLGKALRFLKLSSLTDIPAKNYEAVVAQIKSINAEKARARGAK